VFEFLSHPIIAVMVLLGILVFVHELGHYLVAKFFGVGVETFSIGFGPRILSFTYGKTLYQIAAIPLGGFVKLAGMSSYEEVPSAFKGQEMYKASLFARSLVLIAGPFANFILAICIYGLQGYIGIEKLAPVVGSVKIGSPASSAGLLPEDRILFVNNKAVRFWSDLRKEIGDSVEEKINLKIRRADKDISVDLVPSSVSRNDIFGKKQTKGQIGIAYGMLSSVATFLGSQSSLGIETGDKIKSIYYTDRGENKVSLQVKSWHGFLVNLAKACSNSSGDVEIVFEKDAGTVKKDSDIKKARISKQDIDKYFATKDLDYVDVRQIIESRYGLTNSQLTIGSIEQDFVTKLSPKDVIVNINDHPIDSIYSLSTYLENNKMQAVDIAVIRDGERISVATQLKKVEIQRPEGKDYVYVFDAPFLAELIYPDPVKEIYTNPFTALSFGCSTVWEQSKMMLSSLAMLVSGQLPMKSLGGPIMIAKVAGDSAKAGIQTFISSMAIISINLGIVNLFPIPILDGGQLVLLFFEGIKRRRLSLGFIENFQKIGFVCVLMLTILAMYNDLTRFWSSIIKEMTGFVG
jgi:regulator of sigma E protease